MAKYSSSSHTDVKIQYCNDVSSQVTINMIEKSIPKGIIFKMRLTSENVEKMQWTKKSQSNLGKKKKTWRT